MSLGGDLGFSFADLQSAVRAVLAGAPLYGSNRDRTYPDDGGPSPSAGALVAAVEYAADANARCAGKPERAMFDEARRLLGDGRYLMVGDRLDADVAGGDRGRDGHGPRADGVGPSRGPRALAGRAADPRARVGRRAAGPLGLA